MTTVYIDFETRSAADIKKVGAALYVEDPTTEVLCLGFAVDDGAPDVLTFGSADDWAYVNSGPSQVERVHALEQLAVDPDVIFVAHNTQFDSRVWNTIAADFSPVPAERWRDTMAKCYSHGLPGGLKNAAAALLLDEQKDMEGRVSMLKLSKPRRTKDGSLQFWEYKDCPQDFEKMYSYCKQDITVMRKIDQMLRDLPEKEKKVWLMDQKLNSHGIRFDLPLIEKAIGFAEKSKEELQRLFAEATGGELSKPSERAKLAAWLAEKGIKLKDTQATTVEALISAGNLPWNVAEALTLFNSAGKTSLAKYPAMRNRANDDGVARELMAYHGAHTGRWAGRGIQIQNLPKPQFDMEDTIWALTNLDYEAFSSVYDVNATLSSAIRGMIIPREGMRFLIADLAQIEARIICWLAGQNDVLRLFELGQDVYCHAASRIYGRQITRADEDERQVGKTSILALGYAGGIAAFVKMAKSYRVDLRPAFMPLWRSASQDERKAAEKSYLLYRKRCKINGDEPCDETIAYTADIIKQRWRVANPHIQDYWHRLESTAIGAVRSGGVVKCGHIVWFVHGRFLHCRLPSGRDIHYPYPRVVENKRGGLKLEVMTVDAERGGWVRESTYGGKLSENIDQAIGRDVLVDAMFRMEAAKYPTLFSVHDETVCELPYGQGSLKEYLDLMRVVPKWASGLPIAAEGVEAVRYGKH
jgi:DNA polymerase